MGSNEDELLFDDEAADFLDTEDPEDAIRLARQALNKKIKEFEARRDAFLALAVTVNEGCARNFSLPQIEQAIQSLEADTKAWKSRRTRATAAIEKAHTTKESHLRQLGALTKELESARGQVFEQLQEEIHWREEMLISAKQKRDKVGKWTSVIVWVNMAMLVLVVAAFMLG